MKHSVSRGVALPGQFVRDCRWALASLSQIAISSTLAQPVMLLTSIPACLLRISTDYQESQLGFLWFSSVSPEEFWNRRTVISSHWLIITLDATSLSDYLYFSFCRLKICYPHISWMVGRGYLVFRILRFISQLGSRQSSLNCLYRFLQTHQSNTWRAPLATTYLPPPFPLVSHLQIILSFEAV